jgi:hypothetical protein
VAWPGYRRTTPTQWLHLVLGVVMVVGGCATTRQGRVATV